MFGYPGDATDQETVVLALTLAAVPEAGVFDTDMLYRLQVNPHARAEALWDAAPITPKTPPNPLTNDVPFLAEFPYLAPPW